MSMSQNSEKIKRIARYYLFYGPNEYMLKKKLWSLIKTALPSGGEAFDLDRFDGKRCDSAGLLNSLSTPPAFSPLRVILLENTEKLPAKTQSLLFDFLEKIPEYSVLAMVAETADRRSKLFKYLLGEKKKFALKFDKLQYPEAVKLVVKTAAERDKKLDLNLADTIVGIYGTDPYRLENEIEKLVLLAGEKPEIEKKDLAFSSGFSKIETAYELPELIFDGKIKDALELCGRALASGISEMQILYLFKNHLDRLNAACNLKGYKELMSSYRIPYFAASKVFTQSKRLRQSAITSCISYIFKAEYAIKSARFPSKSVIELMIVAIYLASGGNKR